MKLLLVMPATNVTSERSFSTLRRIKTYLQTTMSQERLNYLMSTKTEVMLWICARQDRSLLLAGRVD